MRRSRVVCRLMWPNRRPAARNVFSKSRYEGAVGPRLRPLGRAARLRLLRISGSHHIYGKPGSVVRLSIPIHGSQPLKAGLLRHLAKLAEFPEDELS